MENNNNDTGPAEARGRAPWLKTAIAISLAMHFSVVVAIVQARLGSTVTVTIPEERPVVTVSLRRRAAPQEIPENIDEATSESGISTPPMPRQTPTEVPSPSGQGSPPPASESRANTLSITPSLAPGSDNEQDSAGTLSADQLSASITRYMDTYSSEQQTTWLQQCQLFRNRYFTNDCTLDPAVRSGDREIPESIIVPLLDDNSVAGALARERYALVAPPRNFKFIPTVEQQLTGPTIALADLNGGGLIPALLRTIWLGITPQPIPAPEFTGPEVPADIAADESEQDKLLTEFEKRPAVFGNSR